jgi:hypothetical protein
MLRYCVSRRSVIVNLLSLCPATAHDFQLLLLLRDISSTSRGPRSIEPLNYKSTCWCRRRTSPVHTQANAAKQSCDRWAGPRRWPPGRHVAGGAGRQSASAQPTRCRRSAYISGAASRQQHNAARQFANCWRQTDSVKVVNRSYGNLHQHLRRTCDELLQKENRSTSSDSTTQP